MLAKRSLVYCTALVALSCAPEVGGDAEDAAEGKVVFACFNPTEERSACAPDPIDTSVCPAKYAPIIPLPNDLLLSDGDTNDPLDDHLALPIPASAPPAEQAFYRYLNTLDGWLPATPITIQFSGPVKPETLAGGIKILCPLCSAPPAPPAPTYDPATHKVTFQPPPGGWQQGATHIVVVIGGDHASAVKDVAGSGVEPEPLMFLLRGENDVSQANKSAKLVTMEDPKDPKNCKDDDGDGVVDEEIIDEATAARLTGLQGDLKLVFVIMKAFQVEREQVALLFSFTPATRPFAVYDPTIGKIPFPNDILRDPLTGKVKLPFLATDSDAASQLKVGLNTLDGFSTTAPWLVESSLPLKADTIAAAAGLIFAVGTPTDTGAVALPATSNKGVVLVPAGSLWEETTYIAYVTTAATTAAGRKLAPSPFMVFLKSEDPVHDGAKSLVSALDDATAAQVEAIRLSLQPAVSKVATAVGGRDKIAALWTAKTQLVTETALALSQTPLARSLPTAVALAPPTNAADAFSEAGVDPAVSVASIERVVFGTFSTLNLVSPLTRTFRPDYGGSTETVAFTLSLPNGLSGRPKAPVVLFRHGLYGHRNVSFKVANALAAQGLATLAIDAPLNGDRALCDSNGDCQGSGTCNLATGVCSTALARTCVDTTVSRACPRGIPLASGNGFIGTNVFATRDAVRQEIVDNAQLLRVLADKSNDLWTDALSDWGHALDENRVLYLGQSAGAIVGPMLLATLPGLRCGVLNAGGGTWVDVFTTAPGFTTTVDALLASAGITRGTPAFNDFVASAKWVLDPADPMNFARFVTGASAAYRLPGVPQKSVFVQYAENETTVPNATTLALAAALGVSGSSVVKYTGVAHGFLTDHTNTDALDDAVSYLSTTCP